MGLFFRLGVGRVDEVVFVLTEFFGGFFVIPSPPSYYGFLCACEEITSPPPKKNRIISGFKAIKQRNKQCRILYG